MKAEKASEMKGAFIGILLLGSMIGGLSFTSCSRDKKMAEEAKQARPVIISGITRVLMHSCGQYSFLIRQKDNKIGQLTVVGQPQHITILEDLSDKEPVRIEVLCGHPITRSWTCRTIPESFSYWRISSVNRMVIHLHSARQINGGGWNSGKSGNRMTTVVE